MFSFQRTNLLIFLFTFCLKIYSLRLNKFSFAPIQRQVNNLSMTSRRIEQTENPYIEDILDRYSHLPNLTNLALGSSYWSPPESCLNGILADISTRDTQRYGNILGYPPLIQKLRDLLTAQGLDLSDENIAITSGANQGFMNVALTLTDAADDVVVLSPYYFSHLLSLQLCQSKVHICSFNNKTLEPNWIELEDLIRQHHPKLVSEFLILCHYHNIRSRLF